MATVFLDTYRLLLAFTRPYEVLQRISLRLALWKATYRCQKSLLNVLIGVVN